MAPTICTKPISPFFSSKTNFVFFFYLHGSVLFLTNMKYCFDAQHSMSTQRFAKYPSPRKLGIGVLGYLFVDIGFETALEALFKQVLLSLASSASENLFEKCTSCSFNSSTPDSCLSSPLDWWTWLGWWTWGRVGEVLPLFRRTSSRGLFQVDHRSHLLNGPWSETRRGRPVDNRPSPN